MGWEILGGFEFFDFSPLRWLFGVKAGQCFIFGHRISKTEAAGVAEHNFLRETLPDEPLRRLHRSWVMLEFVILSAAQAEWAGFHNVSKSQNTLGVKHISNLKALTVSVLSNEMPMNIDPFHLAATPMPMLPHLGLRTQVGLSSEDPAGKRNRGMAFSVWCTLYTEKGERIRRWQVGNLPAGSRKFFDLSELTLGQGASGPHICVVHRIPEEIRITEDFRADVPDDFNSHFEMYRSVVQLVSDAGNSGSVIFEIAPFFNANPKRPSSLLVFSNQAVVGPETDTYLVLMHYSTLEGYRSTAQAKLHVFSPDGSRLATETQEIPAFGLGITSFSSLRLDGKGGCGLAQYSFVGCSAQAAMIPLIINVDRKFGGVSIEHTHSPNSYLNMPPAFFSKVRSSAIEYYLSLGD